MPRQKRLVRSVRVGADPGEDVGPVGGSHCRPDLAGRVGECGLAAGSQQQHLVAHVDVGQRVRHHKHHPAGVGEPAQHRHHLTVQRWVQARGRLVEDQQRRAGQQLHRHRRPLALTTGKLVDPGLLVLGQLELVEDALDDLPAILGGRVRRQPQLGRVLERVLQRQLPVHDVVLGHHSDPGTHRRVFGMQVVPVEADYPGAGLGRTADQLDQG